MTTPTTPDKSRRLEEIARGRAGCFPITPTLIQPEPGFNEREDFGDLEALAADIETNGLQQPLKIRKEIGSETIYLIDGHRRHRAITTILIPQGRWPKDKTDDTLPYPVECTTEKKGTKPVDRLFMQLSMNTGKPFTFLEEARLYQRILAASTEGSLIKAADIARRTGKTKQAISDSLRLVNEGTEGMLAAVKCNLLAASTALHIIKQSATAAEQTTLLATAHAAAIAAGREHIMPKDVPGAEPPPRTADPQSTKPEPSPEAPASSSPDQKSSIDNPQSSIPPSSPKFTLYIIADAPDEPTDEGYYHETERLCLENPPAGIERLHLLSALTREGETCYGYRFNDITVLPDPDQGLSFGTNADEGLPATLNLIIAFSSVFSPENPVNQDAISNALFDALCRYYPEEGSPEEPEHLAFVATATTPPKEESGYQAIINAPSTNRDGSGPGSGGSGFVSPEDGMKSVNKVIEELDGKGIPDRVTSVEIAMRICNGESTPGSLKSFLLGK